jgi:uncharacterized protein YndB with AHSA1/START domain
MAPELVQREILLPATPSDVWDALTDGKRLSEWFGAEVEMEPKLGGRARVRWRDGRERGAVIEALETERLLVLRWLPFERDAEGRTRGSPSTKVRFSLSPGEGGTLLAVEETLPALPQSSRWSMSRDPDRIGPVGQQRAGAKR